MTTEIFQWATVIMLVLISITSISTKGLNEHLFKLRSHLEQIEALLQANRGLSEEVSLISIDIRDIQERMRDNFPTDRERESAVENNP